MILTLHACLRYIERIRPGADKREANLVLADAARRARHEGRRTRTGELVWIVDNPDMLLITKHDPVLRAPVEAMSSGVTGCRGGPWNTWPISKTIGKRGRRMVDERLLALKTARERGR